MDRRNLIRAGVGGVFAAGLLASREKAAAEPANDATGIGWKISGQYFEACNCEVVCPCIFESAPSHGDCTVLYSWRIEKGHDADIRLEGRNVVLAARSADHMQKVKWLAALYVDEHASAEQFAALERIFTGQAGGHPAALAGFFERFLGVKKAPILISEVGKQRSVSIPGILRARIEAIRGQKGGDTTVSGQPLGLAPGEPMVAAKSELVQLRDFDWNWDFAGRAGGYSPFTYQSA